ncbi:MAG: mandelate racemase/muconate lactonizing enzyme family protein [Sphingopyxis sp.]|nr:mandelate racemase/muconate lactonizing enzyme family protein [Sphingopyxis sp.]
MIGRRQMIGAAVLAGAGVMLPFPLLAANRGQSRIAKVEAFAVPRAVFVKVTADDGTAGWGEAGHSGGKFVASLINDSMAAHVIGDDVFAGEATWAKLYYEYDEMGPGGIASQALAGIDCALWDLRGRLLNKPVWALLGGKFRDDFPVYGSFSRDLGNGTYMTPDQAGRRAAELVAEGFRGIKVRMAIREENADPDPDPTFVTAAAVRKAIGDVIPLYVDANNGYRPARAITVGKQLYERLGVEVFEEPVAMHHFASLRQVGDALDMSIAAGEHEYTPWAFRDLIQQGRPDLINPDVSKLSGLTAGLHVASMAELFDVPISVHNARPTLLSAAHAHFIARSRTATRPQEHPGSKRLSELWAFFQNRILPVNGRMAVPTGPGLGLEPDEAAIRAAAR